MSILPEGPVRPIPTSFSSKASLISSSKLCRLGKCIIQRAEKGFTRRQTVEIPDFHMKYGEYYVI